MRADARDSSQNLWLVAALLVVFIGLMIRLWGSDWGLPHPFHPDEGKLVKRALSFGKGDLNPHFFVYPSLTMYVMFFIYGCYYVVGWLVGHFTSPNDLIIEFAVNPQNFFLFIRWLSALLGTLTIWLTYLIGQKLYSRGVGLLAAVFLTFNYLHVMYSHYLMTDVPATFMIMLTFWFSIGIAETARLKYYVTAGLCAGFAISVKYPACFISFSLLAAHLIAVRTHQDQVTLFSGRAWLAAALIPSAFIAGTPYSVLDGQTFLIDLLSAQSEGSRPLPIIEKAGILFFKNLPLVLGVGVYVCSLAGMIRCLWRRGRTEVLLLSFPFVYFGCFLILMGGLRFRDLTPLLPFCALLVALFLVDTVGFFTRVLALRRAFAVALVAIATLVVIFQPAMQSVALAHFLAQPDTRLTAKAWIEHNIPDGARIGVEHYGPPLEPVAAVTPQQQQRPDAVKEWWKHRGQTTEKTAYRQEMASRRSDQWRKYDVLINQAKDKAHGEYPRYQLLELEYLPYFLWVRLDTGQVSAAELKQQREYRAFFEPGAILAENQIEYVVVSSSTNSPKELERLLQHQATLLHRVEPPPTLGWSQFLPFSYLHHPELEIYQLHP